MFSNSSTKSFPGVVSYPKRTLKLAETIAVRDDSTCPHEEAFRLQRKEERYLNMVAIIPLAILLAPALAMIVYLILDPNAFMIPIDP